MTKRDDELEELKKEILAIKSDISDKRSYWDGVVDVLKKQFWLCGLAWTGISLAVSNYGEYAYKHIPVVKRVVDAIYGGSNG